MKKHAKSAKMGIVWMLMVAVNCVKERSSINRERVDAKSVGVLITVRCVKMVTLAQNAILTMVLLLPPPVLYAKKQNTFLMVLFLANPALSSKTV